MPRQSGDAVERCSPRCFPAECAAAELRAPGDARLLLPEEAQSVANAVPKRAQEFAAGRAVRAACPGASSGSLQFPIRAAPDRQPVWPEFLVGSITHTTGFCAAVVADAHACPRSASTARSRARSNRDSGPASAPPTELQLARQPAGRRAAGRGDADLLGQGGVLQMPIPAGRATARFSGCGRQAARVGRGAGRLRPGARAAAQRVRTRAGRRAWRVSIPRAIRFRRGARGS